MTKIKQRIILITLIALWLGEFICTHIPLPKLPPIPGKDKTLHVVAYFILSLAWFVTFASRGAKFRTALLFMLIVFPIYAALDELLQPLVNRHADFTDWRADMFGVLLGCGVFFCTSKAIQFKHKKADRNSN